MQKRYYWIKLDENFFNQKYIKAMKRMHDGEHMTNIWLRLLLMTINTEGVIEFDRIADTIESEIALMLDEDDEIVSKTINTLERMKMIERTENGDIVIPCVKEMTGSESESAERVRKHREKKTNDNENSKSVKKENSKSEKKKKPAVTNDETNSNIHSNTNNETVCNAHVTACNEKVTTDIEKEKDIDIEKSMCVVRIPCVNGWYEITERELQNISHTYDSIDVRKSLDKLKSYLESRPEKQRVKTATPGYINMWLAEDNKKAQTARNKTTTHTNFSAGGYGATYDIAEYENEDIDDLIDFL